MADEDRTVFEGRGGEKECTEFVRSVRSHAFSEGRTRDDEWTADYAATRMTGQALLWYERLDDETQSNWKLLRLAMMQTFAPSAASEVPPTPSIMSPPAFVEPQAPFAAPESSRPNSTAPIPPAPAGRGASRNSNRSAPNQRAPADNKGAKDKQPKQNQPERNQARQNQSQQNQPRQNQPQQNQPRQNQSQQNQPRQNQSQQNQPRQNQSQQNQPRQNQPQQNQPQHNRGPGPSQPEAAKNKQPKANRTPAPPSLPAVVPYAGGGNPAAIRGRIKLLGTDSQTPLYISRQVGFDPAQPSLLRTTQARFDALQVTYVPRSAGSNNQKKYIEMSGIDFRLGMVWNNDNKDLNRGSSSHAGVIAVKKGNQTKTDQDKLFPTSRWSGQLQTSVWSVASDGEITVELGMVEGMMRFLDTVFIPVSNTNPPVYEVYLYVDQQCYRPQGPRGRLIFESN